MVWLPAPLQMPDTRDGKPPAPLHVTRLRDPTDRGRGVDCGDLRVLLLDLGVHARLDLRVHRPGLRGCPEQHQPTERSAERSEERSEARSARRMTDHPADDRTRTTPQREPHHRFRLHVPGPRWISHCPVSPHSNRLVREVPLVTEAAVRGWNRLRRVRARTCSQLRRGARSMDILIIVLVVLAIVALLLYIFGRSAPLAQTSRPTATPRQLRVASRGEVLVHGPHGGGTFADRGRDPLAGATPDVAGGEDPGDRRLVRSGARAENVASLRSERSVRMKPFRRARARLPAMPSPRRRR